MKTRNLYRIVVGALITISSIPIFVMNKGDGIIGTLLLCAGLAFLITGILRHRRYGDDPESDERSKKIGAYGITYAWLTGLFFMTALFWLDSAGILTLSTQYALAASILVLTLSAVLYQAWLFRKGDVE
ncbi:MAG: hypothetical protein GYA23_09445 [Methanomicrobiales archaeon]|nr:hypothetical protein [Methanomicrobiales archaeon]